MASKVVIRILTKDFTKEGFSKASENTKRLSKGLDQANRRMKRLGVLAFGAAVVAIKKFSQFDTGIREVTTLLGDVSEQGIKTMGDEIKKSSIEFGQALDKMTKAKYDIISAGFNDAADSSTLLAQSAKLAVAGVSNVSKTADVLTTVLNAYGKTAGDAKHISDVLFTTVRLGKTTIDQLASSFGNAASIAPQLGVSVEAVAAGISTLTARGIDTAEATTALQATFVNFLKPSEDLKQRLHEIGFESGKAAIGALGFQGALKKVTDGSTEAEKAALFPNIRAMKAVFPLVGTAAEDFAKKLDETKKAAGSTETAYNKMTDSLGFRLKQAKAKIDSAVVGIGEGLAPLAEGFAFVTGAISDMGAAGGRMLGSFVALTAGVWAFSGAITALAGPLGIVAALLGVGLYSAFIAIKTPAERAALAVDKYTKSLESLSRAEKVIEQARLKKELDDQTDKWLKMKKSTDGIFAGLLEGFAATTGNASGLSVELENQTATVKKLQDEYNALDDSIKADDKKAADKAAAEKAALDKSAQILKDSLDKQNALLNDANNKTLAAEAAKNSKLQALRDEFNLSDKDRQLKALADRLAAVNQNWQSDLELKRFYTQKKKELDDQDAADNQARLDAEMAVKAANYQARLDLLAEFQGTKEQQELDAFDRRLAAVNQNWKNDEALEALHEKKHQQILAQQIAEEEQTMKSKSKIWRLGSNLYDSFTANLLRSDITGKKKKELIWKSLQNSFAQMLFGMLKEKIAHAIATKSVMAANEAAAVTAGTATGAALATAYAPAATFASVMSFGGAAATGESALLGALALTKGASAIGAESGMIVPNVDSGIQKGTDKVLTILTPGELVVDKTTTDKIKSNVDGLNGNAGSSQIIISPTFHITTIDASGFEDLIQGDTFKKTFVDMVNLKEITLSTSSGDVEKGEYR